MPRKQNKEKQKYKFEIGQKVITNDGKIGVIKRRKKDKKFREEAGINKTYIYEEIVKKYFVDFTGEKYGRRYFWEFEENIKALEA